MPVRRLRDRDGIRFIVDEFPEESFNLFTERELERILASPQTRELVKQTIFKTSEFEFYKQEMEYNRYEYFIEDVSNHEKTNLDYAMKEGEVHGKDIDTEMYDFLHDFDETLD